MLILERHSGESIQINDDTKLTIYYNKGTQIKIGIDAPRHVSVIREELTNTTNKKNNSSEETDNSKKIVQSESNISDITSPGYSEPIKTDNEFITSDPLKEKSKNSQVIIKTKRKRRVIMPVT